MFLKTINKLVNLKSKLLIITSLLISTFYSYYKNKYFITFNFFVLFVGLFFMDMTISAIKNYIYIDKMPTNKNITFESSFGISKKAVEQAIVLFTICTLIFMLILFLNTGFVVQLLCVLLIIKALQFAYSKITLKIIFYDSYSSTMIFLFIYILANVVHINNTSIIETHIFKENITITFNYIQFIGIFLLAMPTLIANSNYFLCDDIVDYFNPNTKQSLTLPGIINVNNCIILVFAFYILGYVSSLFLIYFGFVNITYIFSLLSFFSVYKNFKKFCSTNNNFKTAQFIKDNIYIINTSNLMAIVLVLLIENHIS